MGFSRNCKLKDVFRIELIGDALCSIFLRITSVQIYVRAILQVRLLRQGDLYEIKVNPAALSPPESHVMSHYPKENELLIGPDS